MFIKKLQAAYIATIIVAALYAILSLNDIIPSNFWALSPEGLYSMELIVLILGLGNTFFALKLFAFGFSKKKLQQDFDNSYKKLAIIRQFMMSLALLTCMFVYFSCINVSSTQYIILILLIAMCFCWPSEKERNELEENSKK